MVRSWQVRLAAVLVGLGVVLGVGLMLLGLRLMHGDPGFLFAILPILSVFLLGAGFLLASSAVALTVRVLRGAPGVRLKTAVLGGCLVVCGLIAMGGSVVAGSLLIPYGVTLVWLMTTPAAARDLGGWSPQVRGSASTVPGYLPTDAPQQGPWSPKPTTLPWTSWEGVSGPRPPWWQTWQAGLARGIPLWELVVLGACLLGFVLALGFVFVPSLRGWSVVLLPLSIGGVWLLEQRMRERLARF
jgi:hypothetical protein